MNFTGQDAITDAQNAGSWFSDRQEKWNNFVAKVKSIWQNMTQGGEDVPPIRQDRETLDEVIENAATYLRNKKGDIESASDAEIKEAMEQSVEGLSIKPKGGDTFLSEETGTEEKQTEKKDYPEPIDELPWERDSLSDSGRNFAGQPVIENVKDKEYDKSPKDIDKKEYKGKAWDAARDQGLKITGDMQVVDDEGNKWSWDGEKWERVKGVLQ